MLASSVRRSGGRDRRATQKHLIPTSTLVRGAAAGTVRSRFDRIGRGWRATRANSMAPGHAAPRGITSDPSQSSIQHYAPLGYSLIGGCVDNSTSRTALPFPDGGSARSDGIMVPLPDPNACLSR